eukprot:4106881-Prymnesium_polylepis.4
MTRHKNPQHIEGQALVVAVCAPTWCVLASSFTLGWQDGLPRFGFERHHGNCCEHNGQQEVAENPEDILEARNKHQAPEAPLVCLHLVIPALTGGEY